MRTRQAFRGYEDFRFPRRSPEQESIEHAVGFLEDVVTDLQDAIGIADRDAFDQAGFRLLDRIEAVASRLSATGQELRTRL